MNLIIPLFDIKFQINGAMAFDEDIIISPLDEKLTQSIQNLLKEREWHFKDYLHLFEEGGFKYFISIPFQKNEQNKALIKASDFLKLMRIVKHNQATLIWTFLKDNATIEPFEKYNQKVYTPVSPVSISNNLVPPNVEFSNKDIEKINLFWINYKEITANYNFKNRISYALFFHEAANLSECWEHQILNDTIALECLFTDGSQEVTFKISSRIAWFLYPKSDQGDGRTGTFRSLKEIYAVRSKIVHGSTVAKAELEKIASDNNRYVRKILRRILEDKNLIKKFTSQQELNEYFMSLTFLTEK